MQIMLGFIGVVPERVERSVPNQDFQAKRVGYILFGEIGKLGSE